MVQGYYQTFKSDIRGTFDNDAQAFDAFFSKEPEKQPDTGVSAELSSSAHAALDRWLQEHQVISETVSPMVRRLTRVRRLDEIFQAPRSSFANAQIILSSNIPGDKSWKAASIVELFSHQHGGCSRTFAMVKEYKELAAEHQLLDRYRDFPVVGGRLLSQDTVMHPHLVALDDIICHFGFTPLEAKDIEAGPCIHVLPLDK